ncbi:MAG: ribonuclease Z [Candidatus Diapherotrites archaeon]|nr:ribonuclease Z [Candidatus Diapherotrites archaeon]
MKGEVVFLGTSAAVPTKDRNHTVIFFRYERDRFLFDCGEGAQRQMQKAKKSIMKISHIFLSHLHGDHVLGLPGIIQTIDFMGREEPLFIHGPKGTKEFVDLIYSIPGCDAKFDIVAKEAKGVILNTDEYYVESFPLEHSVPCVGYVFQEKPRKHIDDEKLKAMGIKPGPEYKSLKDGKSVKFKGKVLKPEDFIVEEKGFKFVYVADTRPTQTVIENASGADILVHEATFTHDALDMAKQAMHSTAREAGEVAREANAKQLVLIHYSPRYKDDELDKLRVDAQKNFDNVLVVRDFDSIEF